VVARQNLRQGINMPLPNNHVFDIYVNGIDVSHIWIEILNLFYSSEYFARKIVFSTSRISAKLFKTLTVEPESNVRVYICFQLLPSREIQKSLDNGLKDPELDYHQTVILKAECKIPSLRVDYEDSALT
ncbi:8130_t:CDS:2, partial [Gigaspora margarita]